MRRLVGTLVCIGSLAAISPFVGAPHVQAETEAQVTSAACRVIAVPPVASTTSVRALAVRSGCSDKAAVRVQIKTSNPGPDKVVRRAAKAVTNGKVTTSARCTNRFQRFYVTAVDADSNVSRSKAARLKCGSSAKPLPTPPPTPPPSGDNDSSTGTTQENEVVRLTNQARKGSGCGALTHDPKLHTAALGHSKDMAAKGYFAHNSQDGRDPGDRIKAAGFARSARGARTSPSASPPPQRSSRPGSTAPVTRPTS